MRTLRHAVLCLFLAACVFCWPKSASAQTSPRMLLEPWEDKDQSLETETDFYLLAKGKLGATRSGLNMNELEATGRYRFDKSLPVSPTVGYSVFNVSLGNTHHALPGQLIDASTAVASMLGKSGDWFYGALIGGGYAGDRPFANGSGWYAKADAIVGKRIDDNHTLLIVLDYNGNRVYMPDIPMPGIAYAVTVSDSFEYVLGAPFCSVTWKPSDKLKINLVYTPVFDFDADISYAVDKNLTLYLSYNSREEAFHAQNLGHDRRLFLDEQRVEAGVRWKLGRSFQFLLAGGFMFGREFNSGFDELTIHHVSAISDEPYVRFGLSFSY